MLHLAAGEVGWQQQSSVMARGRRTAFLEPLPPMVCGHEALAEKELRDVFEVCSSESIAES